MGLHVLYLRGRSKRPLRDPAKHGSARQAPKTLGADAAPAPNFTQIAVPDASERETEARGELPVVQRAVPESHHVAHVGAQTKLTPEPEAEA